MTLLKNVFIIDIDYINYKCSKLVVQMLSTKEFSPEITQIPNHLSLQFLISRALLIK